MNTPPPSSDRPATPVVPRAQALGRRPERADERRQGEAFDRLLKQKTAGLESMSTAFEPAPPQQGASLLPVLPAWIIASPLPPQATPPWSGEPAPALAAAVAGTATAAVQALQATHAASAEAVPLAALSVEAERAAWDVSLGGACGAPLELHASRIERSGALAAPGGWALNLSAQGADAAVLAQHLPRLNERLRTRTAGASHARIQERGEEPA